MSQEPNPASTRAALAGLKAAVVVDLGARPPLAEDEESAPLRAADGVLGWCCDLAMCGGTGSQAEVELASARGWRAGLRGPSATLILRTPSGEPIIVGRAEDLAKRAPEALLDALVTAVESGEADEVLRVATLRRHYSAQAA